MRSTENGLNWKTKEFPRILRFLLSRKLLALLLCVSSPVVPVLLLLLLLCAGVSRPCSCVRRSTPRRWNPSSCSTFCRSSRAPLGESFSIARVHFLGLHHTVPGAPARTLVTVVTPANAQSFGLMFLSHDTDAGVDLCCPPRVCRKVYAKSSLLADAEVRRSGLQGPADHPAMLEQYDAGEPRGTCRITAPSQAALQGVGWTLCEA